MTMMLDTNLTSQVTALAAVGAEKADLIKLVRDFLPLEVAQMEAKLLAKAGQFCTIVSEREVKLLKTASVTNVRKRVACTFRTGIEYNNQAKVIDAHENGSIEKLGLPESTLKLSKVLYYNINSRNFSFCFAPTGNERAKRESMFLVNGNEVSKESLFQDLAASEMSIADMEKAGRKCNRKEQGDSLWLQFKAQDIIEIR